MISEVKQYISNCTSLNTGEVSLKHNIQAEYGLYGLDIIEFYEGFFTYFKIDNPEDFDLEMYSYPEGLERLWDNLISLILSPFSKKARKKRKIFDVTVEHLIKVAESKKWIDTPEFLNS